jgi:spore coat protein A, manganese oxidase
MSQQITGISRREFMKRAGITAAGAGGVLIAESMLVRGVELFAAPKPPPAGQVQLPGNKIPQFVDPLPLLDLNPGSTTGIPVVIADTTELKLNMHTFKANTMPSTWALANPTYSGTWTFGYRVNSPTPPAAAVATSVGPAIVATRNQPTQIRYINNLTADSTTIHWRDWTDQTIHSAFHQADNMMMPPMPPDPMAAGHYMGPVLAVPHLHGGEVPAVIDGGPEAWFASDQPGTAAIAKSQGPAYYSMAGAAANEAIYRYPNTQEASPLWFHDHLLGGTRLNATFGGLAGAYALIDPNLTLPAGLTPVGLDVNGGTTTTDYLIPLVIQDRMFDTNGQLFFPTVPVNPDHPYWVPEFVGDTIIVNGKVWPFLSVEPRRYRFFLINGSNSRPYDMYLDGGSAPSMWVIATDGGYLDAPVQINPKANGQQVKAGTQMSLMMMPGERYEIIIDFAGIKPGRTMILRNVAPTVNGNPNTATDGRIMQFRVVAPIAPVVDNSFNPAAVGATIRTVAQKIVRLPGTPLGPPASAANVQKNRLLTLNEVPGPGGPLEALVNNTKWSGLSTDTVTYPGGVRPDSTFVPGTNQADFTGWGNYLTELPLEGDTEIWEIVNLTMDSHPIHLHAVQFQLINRQPINMKGFMMAYDALFTNAAGLIDPLTGLPFPNGVFIPGFGPPLSYTPSAASGNKYGGNPDVTPFVLGAPLPPLQYEAGWKDTVIMHPGEVSRIAVRWTPQDVPVGTQGTFTFTPNALNGVYVWHCHITDHEDNEMMRPDMILPAAGATRTYVQGTHY